MYVEGRQNAEDDVNVADAGNTGLAALFFPGDCYL